MNHRPILIVSAALGVLAAAIAIQKLLKNDEVRDSLGLDQARRKADRLIDLNSDLSFPASDPPSFSPRAHLG
jgi:hypothetical protein